MTLKSAVAGGPGGLLRLTVTLLLGLVMSVSAVADDTSEIRFDIAPQPLRQALLEFSEQARIQLILAVDTQDIPVSQGVTGVMTAEEALSRLTSGTGLEYHFSSGNTVTVRRQKEEGEPSVRPEKPGGEKDADQVSGVPVASRGGIGIGPGSSLLF